MGRVLQDYAAAPKRAISTHPMKKKGRQDRIKRGKTSLDLSIGKVYQSSSRISTHTHILTYNFKKR